MPDRPISPHFVCLSMIVSRRYHDESPYLTAVDVLAHDLQDPEQTELSPAIRTIFPIRAIEADHAQ